MTHSSHSADLAVTRFRIGAAHCDLLACELVRDGQTHRLEPRLAGVLHLLARRGVSPVTRDEFLDTVWEEDGSDEALNQAISRLRRLLGDASLIRTLPRIGYSLTAPVEAAGALPGPPPAIWVRDGVQRVLRIVKRPFIGGFLAGAIASALVASALWPRTIEREFEILTTGPMEAALTVPDAAE
ncbi:winged helix-turn-helix domain-containing protein [Maricaulis sp. W15]|uniref:winged helix-turn-helix domain-containing protein n=1 Tax=Maricaulis sp. W15 TaxID=1772333 RepID=UPI0009FA43F7|nr:winged helix-turn-helix domain-containing protein [Maricaulis sp. W15]